MAATEVIWFPFRKQAGSGVRLILILRLTRLFDHPPPAIRTPEFFMAFARPVPTVRLPKRLPVLSQRAISKC